ncbi:universal stress protein [Nesterenkonia natronophila]|uniref:Universal stress protein n=1 Tax=Nesterenkonia natronophila TaxID=2174932 RepID=A0A3A4F2D1_9MICC|nr:universal stress protein [Nesterenkonia natronophila]RJN31881.1 universal stress protein [Nesterenkonia natronophila]
MSPTHDVSADQGRDVVVGMDGSAQSERAFLAGLKIARSRDLPLRLVGAFPRLVMTDSYYVTMMDDYLDAAVEETQRMLSGYVSQAEGSGVKVTTRTIMGDPGQTLVEESRTAAVAVVGKRGRNRFSGRFLGSVSSKLAAYGHCPTVVIPEKWESESTENLLAQPQDLAHGDAAMSEPLSQVEESAPRAHGRRDFANVAPELNFDSEVVVGVDVSDHASDVVRLAAEAAAMLDSPLALVSAAPLNADNRWFANTVEHNLELPNLRRPYTDQLQSSAEHISEMFPNITVRWQFFDGSPAGVLSEASRTAALVAVGTRGHGGFAGLVLGSVSQAVLTRAVCPVLVVPTHKS